jgi:hypothetical protein
MRMVRSLRENNTHMVVWLIYKSNDTFIFPLKKSLTSRSVTVSLQIEISHSVDAQYILCMLSSLSMSSLPKSEAD